MRFGVQLRAEPVLRTCSKSSAARWQSAPPISRLGRETRRSLVFSLVIECLHAFHEQREPAVPYARIQQMIRSLDDEVRAYGAEAVQRFVRDVSVSRRRRTEAPPSRGNSFDLPPSPSFNRSGRRSAHSQHRESAGRWQIFLRPRKRHSLKPWPLSSASSCHSNAGL